MILNCLFNGLYKNKLNIATARWFDASYVGANADIARIDLLARVGYL